MNYKLYLDDERTPKTAGPWVIVRNIDEFKKVILQRGIPEEISFDNDLGEGEGRDGIDCAKWMVYDMKFDLRNMKVNVHSANPVEEVNIYALIKNWNKHYYKDE